MKKILVLSLLSISFAGSAFAGVLSAHSPTTGGAVGVYGGNSAAAALAAPTPAVRTSTGVNVLVNPAGTLTDGTSSGYVIAAKHTTGSKIFATASDATNIFWKQLPAGALAAAHIGAGTGASLFGTEEGWTSY